MKKILIRAGTGIIVCLITYILVSVGIFIKYIRMSNNGCIPEDLYTFFKLDELWYLLIASAVIMPVLIWLLPKLPVNKTPIPKWLQIIIKWFVIILFVAMGLFVLWAMFINNPCY